LAASTADDGTLLYTRGAGFPASQLVWVDRAGHPIEQVSERGTYFCPALSRDGRRVAVDISDPTSGQGDIWIYDLAHKRRSRLTYDPGNESSPHWSPDDKRITFISDARGLDNLYQISAGGIGDTSPLLVDLNAKRLTDESRDGRWLVFNAGAGRNSLATDIWIYSTADKSARPWLATPFGERSGTLSPDGKWIAYESNETGRDEIYVRAFPESDEKWLISSAGGAKPAWRGDGREIYYVAPDQKMMAVKVTPGKEFESETPVALFNVRLREHIARQYDVTPDGSRFLLNQQVEEAATEPITVLQNWTARFER
jgi:Tol biopolymer transport system component